MSENRMSDENAIRIMEIMMNKMNQEDDSFWRRFNFLTAINIALAGGYLYIHGSPFEDYHELFIVIIGFLFSGFSLRILWRLFHWHRFWNRRLYDAGERLPTLYQYARPFSRGGEYYSHIKPLLKSTMGNVLAIYLIFVTAWATLLCIVLQNILA